MTREQRNADIIMAYLGGASTREAGEPFGLSYSAVRAVLITAGVRMRPSGRPTTTIETDYVNDTAQSAALRFAAAEASEQLRRRTRDALAKIADKHKRPIGMTMAMCGLNPESRAVVL